MRNVVRGSWLQFTEGLEGAVTCLYNDIRGMTTIAFGNLVNSPGAGTGLPLVWPDGHPASVSEKLVAWQKVHDDPLCASGGWWYSAKLTPLRITLDGIRELALAKLETNDDHARTTFEDWESYPACAQMALHSLWWACGTNVHYPKCFAAVRARDFLTASIEIHMNEITPEGKLNRGLVPRNARNKLLMRNAARIDSFKLDPDTLNWDSLIGIDDDPTMPGNDS